ncbi:MAG TPA: hypothetical protein VII45_02830 [Solirubrobacterales bacterium]
MGGRSTTKILALRAHLNEWLFPDAPRERQGDVSGHPLLVLGLLALGVLLQLLRLGWSSALHTLWAEDGQIFLYGAMKQSFWHDIFATYAGYLVLVPRLIGEAANLVPLQDAPAAVAVLSGAVVSLSGLAVWYASSAHIRNPYLRGALVALTVLAPVASLESVTSAAYVSWYMLFATFWLLLWRPATTRGAAFGSLFILATCLSNPGVWFFAPLAGLRALAARDRRDLMIVGSFAVGAVAQVPAIVFNNESAVTPMWTNDIWTVYLQRVLDGAAFGLRLGGIAWEHYGWPLLIVLYLGAVVGLAIGLRRSTPTARYLAAIAIPTSLLMFMFAVYQRALGEEMVWLSGIHFGDGGRYAIVPALLLVSVAMVLIDRPLRRGQRPLGASWLSLGVVAVLLLGIVGSFDVQDLTARGTPPWDDALKSAAAACHSKHLTEATVPTSPSGYGVPVPCKRLSSFSDAPPGR